MARDEGPGLGVTGMSIAEVLDHDISAAQTGALDLSMFALVLSTQ